METTVGQALLTLSQMTDLSQNTQTTQVNTLNQHVAVDPSHVLSPEQARQRLVEQLLPHIPAEATSLLFDAGYETIDAIRTLNVNLTDPNNDLASAEFYTKRTLKPGHRKLVIQYVTTPPYGLDPNDPANATVLAALGATPQTRKRRRMTDESQSPIPPPDLPTLLQSLERHLSESPVTRHLRKGVDYTIAVEHARQVQGGAEGVWKCLVCNSRPVTISLRNNGRQPQLSNVGTHLKTVKHTTALEQRNASAQFIASAVQNSTDPTNAAAAAAAAIAAVTYQQHQQHQQQHQSVPQQQQQSPQLQQHQQHHVQNIQVSHIGTPQNVAHLQQTHVHSPSPLTGTPTPQPQQQQLPVQQHPHQGHPHVQHPHSHHTQQHAHLGLEKA